MTQPKSPLLTISQDQQVQRWLLHDAAARNGLGIALAHELRSAVNQLKSELKRPASWREFAPATRILVISAEPIPQRDPQAAPVWIAGGNLRELASIVDQSDAGREYAATMSAVIAELCHLPIPVVMIADGAIIGGGAEFFLAGDLRLVSDRSYFSWRQFQAGLALGYGSTERLQAIVGRGWAQRFLLLDENINAETALSCGLCHRITAADSLEQTASTVINDLLKLHPGSVAAQKAMGLSGPAQEAELDAFASLWGNNHHRSVLARFQS